MNDGRFSLSRVLLGSTFGLALVLTFVSVATTRYLASVDLGGPSAAQRLARSAPDPETTGSIRQAAGSVRLDPCTVPARASMRP